MVHSHQTAFFLAPFEHREVNNPKANKFILITQSQLCSHLQTEFAKLLTCFHHVVTGQNQDQITRLGTKCFFHLLQHFLCIELVHTRFHRTVCFYTSINHTFRTNLRLLDEFSQSIQLLAGISCRSFCTDTAYISSIIEY